MKNLQELESRLLAELTAWANRQSNTAGYLYYLPATASHDGGILICTEKPANPEYKLAWNDRINPGASIQQNFNLLRLKCIRSLPVLS